MLVTDCSLYNWMLKWASIIDSKFSVRLTKQKIQQGVDRLSDPLIQAGKENIEGDEEGYEDEEGEGHFVKRKA